MHRLIKIAVAAFLVSTVKTLPLAYMLRFYYQVLTVLTLQRPRYRKLNRTNTFGITSPKDLFRWVPYTSYVSPLEIDMYLHKSNSTYFTDLDIARTKLITHVFQKLFYDYFDNVKGEFKGKSISNYPYIPIGTVQCTFKHELKCFQRFTIESRVFAWDRKWLYVLSKFTTEKKLHAYAVTKYVFKKNGRMTMPPIEYIKDCGLWDESVEEQSKKNLEMVKGMNQNEDWEEICLRLETVLD